MKANQQPRLIERDGRTYIYDVLRRKYVVCTPEEEIRQRFVDYLMGELGYPRGLIAVEAGLQYNTRLKRTDIVVYNNLGKPFILVECKRAGARLGKEAVFQLATYNKTLDAEVLVITNGAEMICLRKDRANNTLTKTEEVPAYNK